MRTDLLEQLDAEHQAQLEAELQRHQTGLTCLANAGPEATACEFERHMNAIEQIMFKATHDTGNRQEYRKDMGCRGGGTCAGKYRRPVQPA